jgi:LuxR family maltose regulon positive regulatory protein
MGVQEAAREAPSALTGALAPPLLATKLAIPPPSPTLVSRPRLTARLEAAGCRLVLVVAPAGSGKTSLVSQWCREHAPDTVAWLSLDAHDNDPNRFLQALCAALERVAPDAVRPVTALFESLELPSPVDALTLLLNGLAAREQPVTLVLDDTHTIEAPAVHQLMASLLEHRPPALCLILASRVDPPLPLARLRARGELVELRVRDLRFTCEEASCFLNERMGLDLTPEAVRRLTKRAEGWIAGLQLAALSLQGHPEPEQFVETFSGSHRFVVDYLVEEVLARQPEEVRTFLRQTSILEQMCGPLCEAVTGLPGGQAMLERLEAANLFLIPLDEERRWYRYHHLFAEVLRVRPVPLSAEEVAALHERAAAWYEAEGMVAEAIGHALAGGHFERALGLIGRGYEAMSQYAEQPTLEPWLRAVAAPLIQTQPLLSLAVGFLCVASLRIAEVEKILGMSAFELPQQATGSEPRELQGRRLALLGMAARLEGEGEAAEARSRQALALLTHDSPFWRGWVLRTLGLACADRGDMQQATDAFAAARAEAEKLDDPVPLLRTNYAAGGVYESQGALNRAERLYEEALEFARPRRVLIDHERALDHLVAGPLFAVMGRLCYERDDLPGARAHLEEALKRTESRLARIDPGWAVVCLFEMLRLQSALGETADDDALFERLAATARGPAARFFEPVVAALRARRPETPAEETGAWLEAFEARTAGGVLPARPMPDSCPLDVGSLEIGTWARLRLAQGRAEAVVARLEQFLGRMAQQGRHGSALPVRVLLATLHWEARRQDRAVAVLEPALALAAREGYVRIFLEAGSAVAPVLRACAAQGIAPETVARLLAALGERPGSVAPVSEDGASKRAGPLTGRELEVLRLAAAGLSNETIAAQLFLSIGTVKRHLHNINDKLAATSRHSAVARARELRLL